MERSQMKRVFSRVGLGVSLFLIVQQIAVMIISVIVSLVAPQIAGEGWYFWLLSYIPLYLLGFPVMVLVLRTIPNGLREPAQIPAISPGNMLHMVVISWGIVFPLNLLSTGLAYLVSLFTGIPPVNPLAEIILTSNPFLTFFIVVIVAPIMEELVFRRMLYNKLIPFGGKCYILVSAMLFALFHVNLYQLFYAFVLGLLFAGLTYYTGTIKYSIILHMLINFMGSGGNTFLLAYGSETAIGIYGVFLMILAIVGIVLAIRWWSAHRRQLRFSPAQVPLPDKRVVFLNFGMLFHIIFMGAFTLFNLLAEYLVTLFAGSL